jgi:hypothetical protein
MPDATLSLASSETSDDNSRVAPPGNHTSLYASPPTILQKQLAKSYILKASTGLVHSCVIEAFNPSSAFNVK